MGPKHSNVVAILSLSLQVVTFFSNSSFHQSSFDKYNNCWTSIEDCLSIVVIHEIKHCLSRVPWLRKSLTSTLEEYFVEFDSERVHWRKNSNGYFLFTVQGPFQVSAKTPFDARITDNFQFNVQTYITKFMSAPYRPGCQTYGHTSSQALCYEMCFQNQVYQSYWQL